ncbi:MAG: hypothetical protein FWH01_11915 [Oscillospiraceae bacterium]|nr:hypothetical protein [Oscillospiraceae bacterium]
MLCFDKETESKFKKIFEFIAESGVSRYMIETETPPHISITCFSTDNIELILNRLNEQLSSFKTGNIVWPSLGMFVPHTLFAAPVLNEYLLNACININRLIEPYSTVGENGFYLPYNWIPHTTLAHKLKDGELQKAIDIALKHFSFIAGKSIRLKLVAYKSIPYEEIGSWDLI